ncbi:uncharacterized protein LOC109541974 [Dendroctonus ponderosae]|uniref:uncharacterized protein LOC109541974 n=1 Tax=Dendroctonus ponderosae TaxID=77166 RepID=UPI002035D21D|nr:uncharacterized protein LOC109541974 [Dendroctonus ponderosae]KAH1010809.1 hypothetical protein HUJ05_005052 [Dendroctonus ponderosae]
MALSQALLQALNNDEEPLGKRLRIAENALKSPEFVVQHKEALLLKWIVSVSSKEHSIENGALWDHIITWLASGEFMDLTQNCITNDDMFSIMQVFQNALLDKNVSQISIQNVDHKEKILKSVQLLCSKKVFQQYFKYNLEMYCRLLACSLENLNTESSFLEFFETPFLFCKHLVDIDGFSKQFLTTLYDAFVGKVLQFHGNSHVFLETVKIIERCLLYGHFNEFQSFFDRIFDDENTANGTEHNLTPLPKSVFKHLVSGFRANDSPTATSFKLFFSAFCSTSKDSQYSFKCFILLVHLLKFDVSADFRIKTPFKRTLSIQLSKSLQVLLELLDALSARNFDDSVVAKLSQTEFLRKMLKSLMALNILNSTVFEIIIKCISINPLLIEPLISSLAVFVMLRNHHKCEALYEKVVIAIFEVFAKLHRVENLVSKLIPALKWAFISNAAPDVTQVFEFNGERDVATSPREILPVGDVFTENILAYFTSCLIQLASWQVINVFKTMLHHLKNTVEEFSRGDFDDKDSNGFVFLELLGSLTTCLLQSIRIADHAIPQNVVTKFVSGLDELRSILKCFGASLLQREHNQVTMRTFLSLAYVWAEIYATLAYYSINNEVQVPTQPDRTHSATDLTYLQSYMDVKEWQTIEQRISNFGKYPCKTLLQKLYIQKAKAMVVLEKKPSEDVLNNIATIITAHLDDTWEELVKDKFVVNAIFPKMDTVSLTLLAEHLMENQKLFAENHVKDSINLCNAMAYVALSKINKLFTRKRKMDLEGGKPMSSMVFSLFGNDAFFTSSKTFDMTGIVERAKSIFETPEHTCLSALKSKETQLRINLGILKKLPLIYSESHIQKCMLLFLMALNRDIDACSDTVKTELEDLIIGIVQAYKWPLSELFNLHTLGAQVLSNFARYCLLFSLVIDNAFKDESSISSAEPLISSIAKKLEKPKHLSACLVVLQAINKVKKSKLDAALKDEINRYKEKILKKLSKLVCQSDYLVEVYAICLKHYFSAEKESETLIRLVEKLESYIEYALANICEENKYGCLMLFILLLQNRTQLDCVKDDMVLKIWNSCKRINMDPNFAHLVSLVVSQIPIQEFQVIMQDLGDSTEEAVKSQSSTQLVQHLKTWESILACDVNAIKMNIYQRALERLISRLLPLLNSSATQAPLESIINLLQRVLQTQHFILSPPLVDMLLMAPMILMKNCVKDFEAAFNLSISVLEMFLKARNAIVMARLPVYLQQYRGLLKAITNRSNSDKSSADKIEVKTASDCVHRFEKLTKSLVACKRDMGRTAVFLIADILEQYERINLYPEVKLHLNNCVYSLISLCDHHAISYLMRVLSNASTEMFKIMYDHYKKYYKFTGKV